MKNLDTQFTIGNSDMKIISHFAEERSNKLKRIKRAVTEGTYQIKSPKLANKLISLSNFFSFALLTLPSAN
jgi:anti-sigma28 factor (negative regulator of flagellin synthesis)